ncbi:AP2/ERF and B3 domain-containing transcription factor At1g50680-like [Henckelia pumila]|uniref:AP2/ERF and B3 domain-containing transcription factor At1g50680-like n=1 Tax=Henckelia pumila TaxID=405737 RepID=UPI003C6E0B4C
MMIMMKFETTSTNHMPNPPKKVGVEILEEEMLNMFSGDDQEKLKKNVDESCDSNCSIYPCKRPRVLERFKGVVPQQNGHWGAQIYANHHRIWLGTFKSEIDAAMAYDTAAIKLRSGDSHRNFPWTGLSVEEPKFQSHFTTDAVLNMIRDGSYPSKFAEFVRNQRGELELMSRSGHGHGFSCTLLFEKELTPSDVGKLNRLVIPKRYAVKHFPNVPDHLSEGAAGSLELQDSEVELEFYDRQMRLWKFRYCYWKSSQSFVFTRGWNRFVKEKCLRANDTISFYLYESCGHGRHSFLVIDKPNKTHTTTTNTNTKPLGISTPPTNIKGVRLFGVQID